MANKPTQSKIGFVSPLRLASLWVLVVVSGIAVALVSHQCRQQYAQLMAMEREANKMEEDYGKYLLEQSAWGSLQRIETMAAEELNMRSPSPQDIVMVNRQ